MVSRFLVCSFRFLDGIVGILLPCNFSLICNDGAALELHGRIAWMSRGVDKCGAVEWSEGEWDGSAWLTGSCVPQKGYTPLHHAVWIGPSDPPRALLAVKALLAANANVDAKNKVCRGARGRRVGVRYSPILGGGLQFLSLSYLTNPDPEPSKPQSQQHILNTNPNSRFAHYAPQPTSLDYNHHQSKHNLSSPSSWQDWCSSCAPTFWWLIPILPGYGFSISCFYVFTFGY